MSSSMLAVDKSRRSNKPAQSPNLMVLKTNVMYRTNYNTNVHTSNGNLDKNLADVSDLVIARQMNITSPQRQNKHDTKFQQTTSRLEIDTASRENE